MSIKIKLIIVLFVVSFCGFSQTNHPTISNVAVSYKPSSQTTTASLTDMQVIPMATVTLNSSANINKIHFKIVSMENNEVLYQVNYSLNASPVTNAEGIKLFENNNGVVSISSGATMTLKPYLYKIQTEDNQSSLSTVLTETH